MRTLDPIWGELSFIFLLSGGVMGSLVFLVSVAFAFWFIRRRPFYTPSKQRPVNVIQDEEDGNGENHWHDLPPDYTLEPFLLPDVTTIRGMSEAVFAQDRPPSISSTGTVDVQYSQTPMTTTPTRKSAASSQLRLISIIQHDDADPNEESSGEGEPEMIELPPAYSNIHRTRHSPLTSSIPITTRSENDS